MPRVTKDIRLMLGLTGAQKKERRQWGRKGSGLVLALLPPLPLSLSACINEPSCGKERAERWRWRWKGGSEVMYSPSLLV
jgi:hypothetical protein